MSVTSVEELNVLLVIPIPGPTDQLVWIDQEEISIYDFKCIQRYSLVVLIYSSLIY